MKVKNTVLLFFVMASVPAYSMDKRPYSLEEKQFWLQKQMPADHPWFNNVDRDEVDILTFSREALAKRKAIETVMQRHGFTHIKCPEAYVFSRDRCGLKQIVQSVDEITPYIERTFVFVEKRCKSDEDLKINAGQAEELSTLFRSVYLHDSDIAVTKNGVYVKTAASGVEHFATSWQKIWFNGLKFDEAAIEVFNRKQLELQGYIVRCIKQYQKDHPGEEINGYTRLPLLPVPDEVAIEGQQRICAMPLNTTLQYLFANDAQHDAFWRQIEEE